MGTDCRLQLLVVLEDVTGTAAICLSLVRLGSAVQSGTDCGKHAGCNLVQRLAVPEDVAGTVAAICLCLLSVWTQTYKEGRIAATVQVAVNSSVLSSGWI